MTRGCLQSGGCSRYGEQAFKSKSSWEGVIAGSRGGRENETGRQPSKGTSPGKLLPADIS